MAYPELATDVAGHLADRLLVNLTRLKSSAVARQSGGNFGPHQDLLAEVDRLAYKVTHPRASSKVLPLQESCKRGSLTQANTYGANRHSICSLFAGTNHWFQMAIRVLLRNHEILRKAHTRGGVPAKICNPASESYLRRGRNTLQPMPPPRVSFA